MPTSHRGPARLLATSGALRAQALAIVALLNIGVVAAASAPPAPPAAVDLAASFSGSPLTHALVAPATPGPASTKTPAPSVRTSPAPRPTKAKPSAAKPKRYVPTGTGMWTYLWDETEGGNARRIVSRARMVGLSHIYVRTGTRKGGFDAAPQLRQLLPATKGTGIQVIAWDFPQLANPVADARRLAKAAWFRVPGAPRIMSVAPDIETGAEGTKLSTGAVDTYMRTLRRLLPSDVSIIGVVPWPSEKRIGRYPFGTVAKYSDAVAPMAYWVNRDPATVVSQSIKRLAVFGKPILPIGQAYDPRIDVPTLKWGAPSRKQVDAFLGTAAKLGAPSASLWVWQFASLDHWKSLQAARGLYEAKDK